MSTAALMGMLLAFIARLITGAQGHWRGCPPMAEQRIYFANHQSHLDWVLIWAALPHELRASTRPIAARDYWTKTPFRMWLTSKVFNAVYVSRTRPKGADAPGPKGADAPGPKGADAPGPKGADTPEPKGAEPPGPQGAGTHGTGGADAPRATDAAAPLPADEDPLEPLVEALRAGDSLVIFPEGTRSARGEPMPFRSGLYHLAEQFPHVPLVPAWIDNVQRVMPKGEVVPVPILCSVTFGEPITLQPGEDKRAFLERARAAVLAERPRVA